MLLASASLPEATPAQQLTEMQFEGRPSVTVAAAERVAGCGVRVVGVEMISLHPPRGRTVDASFVIDANGLATVKALSHEMDPTLPGGKPRSMHVDTAWFRAQGAERTAPMDGQIGTSPADPGVVMYVSKLEPALAVLAAIRAGQEIEVAVQRSEELMLRVYHGKVRMAANDTNRLFDCVEGLSQSMQHKSRGKATNP